MASQKYFDLYPGFPDDIPVARIAQLSLSKLTSGDEEKRVRLFKACTELGFFLLELNGDDGGGKLLTDLENMFRIEEELFDLPDEEKILYNLIPPHKLLGYKAVGVMKTETGQPDKCEFFHVSRDEMLGIEPAGENPQVIRENQDKILGLTTGTLSSLQSVDQPSGTIIRMVRYPSQTTDDRRTALLPHTDYGTLTLLVSVLGGLQILPHGASEWQYVEPKPGCVIVNVGDALVEWTGGVLRSNLHRATVPPGLQAECVRHSIAYLIRLGREIPMRRLVGGHIPAATAGEDMDMTASEWEMKKTMALKAGADIARSHGGTVG
ncbi:hypothetical protein HYFRA_00006728 [Hymenoscyphus fraxineus]|uniref:Fe2OG dioxygenase domain-containing protein n=1 Tax=Hymenoscyphus fraxineus TaxID=746836 RepID=A0A9N9KVF6_9HELO|nr:hypothetical protein HYFRA_00006728 [Hymenoscyphus fraxineus]